MDTDTTATATDLEPVDPERRRRRLALALFGSAALLTVSLGTPGVLAVFGDEDSIGANTFTTGTLALSTDPVSAAISFSGMVPGDEIIRPITVRNDGTIDLRYAVTASATDADGKHLKDALLTTWRGADVTTPGTPCDDFDGPLLANGDLDGALGVVIGSTAPGAQAGDRELTVASPTETLCVRVALPGIVGNDIQGAATTATFTFTSEQVDNNP